LPCSCEPAAHHPVAVQHGHLPGAVRSDTTCSVTCTMHSVTPPEAVIAPMHLCLASADLRHELGISSSALLYYPLITVAFAACPCAQHDIAIAVGVGGGLGSSWPVGVLVPPPVLCLDGVASQDQACLHVRMTCCVTSPLCDCHGGLALLGASVSTACCHC
jgi:hypothetical protein